ncbi:hypothetical protein ACTHAL_004258 [Priestia flexa]|nr:hypothetical protein [Priestia flexa]
MGRIEIFKLSKAELEMYKKQSQRAETLKRPTDWKWPSSRQKKRQK